VGPGIGYRGQYAYFSGLSVALFPIFAQIVPMLQSMTGYGKASATFTNRKITVEIKSLNSKSLDLYAKIPSVYKEKEIQLRKRIGEKLELGKVEIVISAETNGEHTSSSINADLFRQYYREITGLSKELNLDTSGILPAILRLPDVCSAAGDALSDQEWKQIEELVDAALVNLIEFRLAEGKAIAADLEKCIVRIQKSFDLIPNYESERIPEIRTRIENNLKEFAANSKVDRNRFEQELIYYLEKIDISEEKQRLTKHLEYFLETMKLKGAEGKKLGFISQEIGREMNTLGSKAYHIEIQKLVVQMKDELERIKEQILNVV